MQRTPTLHLALRTTACLLLLAAAPVPAAWAQSSDALYAQAETAFEAEDYAEARALLERATAQDAANADAFYLLSRVYYETPLRDVGRAADAIKRARELDPGNVDYMAADLQVRREDSWNFIVDFIKASERRGLARDILERDSTNSLAHEELGTQYIRDYWFYRNAIDLPTLAYERVERRIDEQAVADENLLADGARGPGQPRASEEQPVEVTLNSSLNAADEVGVTNPFDVDALRQQGVGVLDLSARADLAYERAIGHFEDALRYDPRRYPVYEQMMALYALAERYDDAATVLERMYVNFDDRPLVWLFLGLTNHRLGLHEAAAKSFDEAFDLLSEDERAAFEDLSLLLNGDELRAYRADPEAYAARFWTSQDPRLLTPYNERRLEHYSRLVYADLLYDSDDLGLRGWDTERGRIIVRYGPPNKEVTLVGSVEEALGVFGVENPNDEFRSDIVEETNVFNIWDYGEFQLVFEDPLRNGEFRLYSPPADFFADASFPNAADFDYEMRAREIVRETPERYAYEAPGRQVELPFLVNTFRGDDGRTDVFLHYGIPLAEAPAEGEGLVDLTIRTGAFLVDGDYDVVHERRRTLYGLRTNQVRSFEGVTLWADTQTMQAAPGAHEISIEFETAAGGASAVQRREIAVPDYTGADLALSDLLLAYRVEETDAGIETRAGEVVRRDLVIDPAPWAVFRTDQPIYLYFEVYNLGLEGDQARYEVEAALAPKDTSRGISRLFRSIFGGGEQGVAVQFPVTLSDTDDGQYIIMDASEQDAGLYTLALRVRDTVTGKTVETDRDLLLE